eukprot:1450488-Lingulodinium_polyedra.AAC.1
MVRTWTDGAIHSPSSPRNRTPPERFNLNYVLWPKPTEKCVHITPNASCLSAEEPTHSKTG